MKPIALATIVLISFCTVAEAARARISQRRRSRTNVCTKAGCQQKQLSIRTVDRSRTVVRGEGAAAVIAMVNAERRAAGLGELQPANLGAQSHAATMAARGRMFHASGHRENVAVTGGGAGAVYRMWLRSPGHAANMKFRSATRIDVAVSGRFWCLRVR